jgi:glycosyltransferase involved in cell wall biosynthesis
MTKLNILFSHYGREGYEGFGRSFMLARGLATLGHSVTFLTSQESMVGKIHFPYIKKSVDGVFLISFPDIVPNKIRSMGLGPMNIYLKSVYSISKRYDIVHSDAGHRPSSGIPCLLNRLIGHSKYISEWWDFHGKGGIYDDRPWWYQCTLGNYDSWAEIHNKKISDGVIALSEFTKNRAINYGINKNRILVLRGGADIDNISYIPHTGLRSKYGIPEDCLTFCFIGMSEGELPGLDPFLTAVKTLRHRIKIKWFTTGNKLNEVIKRKYDIGSELMEFGWIDYTEYSDILSCADIFLLLQKNLKKNKARWPNKLGDYLAAGRLIMANPVGEVTNFMKKYPNSFVCVDWSKDSIENAILDLATHKNKLPNIGQINREIAEKYCSWQIQSELLSDFYYKILK